MLGSLALSPTVFLCCLARDSRGMNYRHAYHAGNFADVVKHLALVAILQHLRKKDTAFGVFDTHAGRGLYDLDSLEAKRTGEANRGIRRILGLKGATPTLSSYLEVVRGEGYERYPGSPRIAARLLRERDRLVAIEMHPEDAAALRQSLSPFPQARVLEGDGYRLLAGLIPPPERRGLVLVDPPYESDSDFHDMAEAVLRAHRRFATGIYLAWFPIKSSAGGNRFCEELLAGGIARLARVDIEVSVTAETEQLSAAGLAVVNPPFGFVEDMRACTDVVAPLLGQGRPAQVDVRTLADG
jgi:23S rRNA (adenine2030-N6)-methyltransferase